MSATPFAYFDGGGESHTLYYTYEDLGGGKELRPYVSGKGLYAAIDVQCFMVEATSGVVDNVYIYEGVDTYDGTGYVTDPLSKNILSNWYDTCRAWYDLGIYAPPT